MGYGCQPVQKSELTKCGGLMDLILGTKSGRFWNYEQRHTCMVSYGEGRARFRER